MHTNTDTVAEIIIALERQALNHWNRGDVEGQLRFYAEDVTYFDPITPTRIDGWPAVADYFRRVWAGKVNIPRYNMVNPCVLAGPDLAVLSYNLVNYFPGPDGSEMEGTRWNSTQVYRRAGDQWRVIHVHWSFTKHPAFDKITVQG
jgi:ketosteroid isomerase-like protein